MRTLALRPKFWRLLFVCLATLFAAFAATLVDAAVSPAAPASVRDFWVWDLKVMPPAFRRTRATLRAAGNRSLIYVEDKFWAKSVSPEYVNRLTWQLERAVPASAFLTDVGLVALEETLFGNLPKSVGPDDRLIVLFADLGQYRDHQFDGFFNVFDRLSDKEAWSKYQQHSNEANVIYLNGFRRNETYTTGVIAHELHHLLSAASRAEGSEHPSWLSESLAEGAMLLSGFFSDQTQVDRLVQNSGRAPLVTANYVNFGPQLLFSSFLIDTLPTAPNTAIGFLTKVPQSGKAAVEQLYADQTGLPLSFDAIFSNFVSYTFAQSEHASNLPNSWRHTPAIVIPRISPYYTFKASSGELSGSLAPYSFVAIDLAQALSPEVVIQVQRENPAPGTPGTCPSSASVLWKPVNSTRVALYAVGCEPKEKNEQVGFRLKILDQPTLRPRSPLQFLPY